MPISQLQKLRELNKQLRRKSRELVHAIIDKKSIEDIARINKEIKAISSEIHLVGHETSGVFKSSHYQVVFSEATIPSSVSTH